MSYKRKLPQINRFAGVFYLGYLRVKITDYKLFHYFLLMTDRFFMNGN
jgi:hypothetical protein